MSRGLGDVYKRQVWGWCQTREDFRLFKLNRMTELTSGESFAPRSAPLPDLTPERIFPAKYQVTVLFDPACRWRLVEEYGADRFIGEPDGRLRFPGGFPDGDSVLRWVLTVGAGWQAALYRRLSGRGQRAQLGPDLWRSSGAAGAARAAQAAWRFDRNIVRPLP